MSTEDIFSAAEKVAQQGAPKKAYWTGLLSLNLPELQIENQEYRLKAAKADAEITGGMEGQGVYYMQKSTQRKVVKKQGNVVYQDGKVLSVDDMIKSKLDVVYSRELYFDAETQAPVAKEDVGTFQDNEEGVAEEVGKFETSKRTEVGRTVPLDRLSEFAIESVYMLGADTKKGVDESSKRIRELADLLLKNNVGLYIENFVLRAGWTVHDCIVYPYRIKEDEKMWLLMAITQGQMKLDLGWAIEVHDDKEVSKPIVKAAKVKRR